MVLFILFSVSLPCSCWTSLSLFLPPCHFYIPISFLHLLPFSFLSLIFLPFLYMCYKETHSQACFMLYVLKAEIVRLIDLTWQKLQKSSSIKILCWNHRTILFQILPRMVRWEYYIRWIINKDPLRSTGNSLQYSMRTYMRKESEIQWIYVYVL